MDDRDGPAPEGLDAWREQLLATTLRIVLVLGVLVGVPSIAFAMAVDEPLVAIVDVAALALLAFITFRSGLRYRTRAVTLLAMTYLLGVFLLLSVGVVAQLYLLAFPVFAAVLLGLRPALVALVLNAATLITAGMVDAFDTEVYVGGISEPLEWGLVVLNFLFVNTVMAVFCAVLLERLHRSLRDEHAITASIERQRADLAATNRDLEREVDERARAEMAVQRLAIAVAQARDVIVIGDEEGAIVYTNEAYERLVSQATGVSRVDKLVELWPDLQQRDEIVSALRETETWAGTLPVQAPDGTELEFDAQLASVITPDDEVAGTVAVLRDVTNERRMEARLRRSEKLEALGTLASGTAHDFNNVLASILAVAEMTEARSDDKQVQHGMELIVSACERARDVVRQMMVFGRRSDLGAQPVSLTELLERSLLLLRAALPANVRIETDLEADATILARPADLDQVVTNLAANAAHAMGNDPAATLSFATRVVPSDQLSRGEHPLLDTERDHIELVVADTGHGIPAVHLDAIFDPYFTTKDHREGNGLGLASVHAIVASLDGDVHVTSTSGQGATFRILLPIVAAEGGPEPPGLHPGLDEPATSTVLFVDDEEVLRTVTTEALSRRGYVVHSAKDGAEALELFQEVPSIDVLVTDMSMPGMSGAELIARLRERRPDLPVVVCSGYVEAAGLSAAEVSSYLAKPFTFDELETQIREAAEWAPATPS